VTLAFVLLSVALAVMTALWWRAQCGWGEAIDGWRRSLDREEACIAWLGQCVNAADPDRVAPTCCERAYDAASVRAKP
jgi:hypothetical protein